MQLVGISGKAGSGKDYIASHYLVPSGFRPWSLAWHFKIWIVGQGLATYQEVFHTKPARVRTLLQQAGTEQGRNVYGENIWCDTATAWIRLMAEQWGQTRIVIPDIRFPNEVTMVQQLGGKVIRIDAPQRSSQSSLTSEQRLHPSETALDDAQTFDLVLPNDPGAPDVGRALDAAFTAWDWQSSVDDLRAGFGVESR